MANSPYQNPYSGGGGGGDADAVEGPASATDNAIARYNGTTGKLIQDSAVTVADVSGASVTVATTAGNALVVDVTEPAATTGASQVGKSATINASDAVASTDTAGAAAGGDVILQGGAAARLTSGNAAGGNLILRGGTGIGTGVVGQVLIPSGADAGPGVAFEADTDCGLRYAAGPTVHLVTGGSSAFQFGSSFVQCNRASLLASASVLTARRSVVPKTTSPVSVSANDDNRKVITNEGASGSITFNLPSAAAGYEFIFIVQATQNMVITAAGGDTIRIAGGVSSSGGAATNGVIGGFLQIVAINGAEWVAGAVQGTWALS